MPLRFASLPCRLRRVMQERPGMKWMRKAARSVSEAGFGGGGGLLENHRWKLDAKTQAVAADSHPVCLLHNHPVGVA
jgi:hypothetical protein